MEYSFTVNGEWSGTRSSVGSVGSKGFQTKVSVDTSMKGAGVGTNPEELVAAAHAGCFTMKLSFVLGEAGFTPENLETKCEITFENGAVTKSHLIVKGTVPGISKEKFDACVKDAEKNCPISKLLNTTITSEASLT